MAHGSPRTRLLALLALAVLPWTVILVGSAFTFAFPFAFVTTGPLSTVWLWDLLRFGGGLPRSPLLLPLAALLYVLAVVSALGGVRGREDPRLTAGLLVLAGVAHLGVAWSVLHRLAYTPVPAGVVVVFGVAWWFYWPDLRALLLAPVSE
jgi:uncharacterized protein (TIGR04206 family)